MRKKNVLFLYFCFPLNVQMKIDLKKIRSVSFFSFLTIFDIRHKIGRSFSFFVRWTESGSHVERRGIRHVSVSWIVVQVMHGIGCWQREGWVTRTWYVEPSFSRLERKSLKKNSNR